MGEFQWQNMMKQQLKAVRDQMAGPTVASCPECGCEWFEQVEVSQLGSVQVPIGAEMQRVNRYMIAKCIGCGMYAAPPTSTLNVPQNERKLYDACLDTVERCNDLRAKLLKKNLDEEDQKALGLKKEPNDQNSPQNL